MPLQQPTTSSDAHYSTQAKETTSPTTHLHHAIYGSNQRHASWLKHNQEAVSATQGCGRIPDNETAKAGVSSPIPCQPERLLTECSDGGNTYQDAVSATQGCGRIPANEKANAGVSSPIPCPPERLLTECSSGGNTKNITKHQSLPSKNDDQEAQSLLKPLPNSPPLPPPESPPTKSAPQSIQPLESDRNFAIFTPPQQIAEPQPASSRHHSAGTRNTRSHTPQRNPMDIETEPARNRKRSPEQQLQPTTLSPMQEESTTSPTLGKTLELLHAHAENNNPQATVQNVYQR